MPTKRGRPHVTSAVQVSTQVHYDFCLNLLPVHEYNSHNSHNFHNAHNFHNFHNFHNSHNAHNSHNSQAMTVIILPFLNFFLNSRLFYDSTLLYQSKISADFSPMWQTWLFPTLELFLTHLDSYNIISTLTTFFTLAADILQKFIMIGLEILTWCNLYIYHEIYHTFHTCCSNCANYILFYH